MRPDRARLRTVAIVALLVAPCSTLRADDAALTRRLRNCGSSWPTSVRRSTARRGSSRTRGGRWWRCSSRSKARREVPKSRERPTRHRRRPRQPRSGLRLRSSQQPTSRTAAEPEPDLPAGGRHGGRVPGFDPHSRDRVGLEARRSGAIGRRSHAGRPRDRRSVRHLLDPRRRDQSRRTGAHGLLAHREPVEHRPADAESARADAPVHRERLRRSGPGDEAAARVPPDEALRRRPDMVHVLGSAGRPHRDRLRRPERHLAFPAAAVSVDAERHKFTLPVGIRRREPRARSHRRSGDQLHARLRRAGSDSNRAANAGCCSTRVTCRRPCWPGSCAARCPASRTSSLVTGGIGGTVSGVLIPRWDADDRIKFAVNGGSGIGRYVADLSSLGGQDAVYDPVQVRLRALPVASGYVGYEHAWSRTFTTAVTYGVVNVEQPRYSAGGCVPPDPAGLGESDVESGSVRRHRRRVPGRQRASTRMASAPPRVRFRAAGRSSSDQFNWWPSRAAVARGSSRRAL